MTTGTITLGTNINRGGESDVKKKCGIGFLSFNIQPTANISSLSVVETLSIKPISDIAFSAATESGKGLRFEVKTDGTVVTCESLTTGEWINGSVTFIAQ